MEAFEPPKYIASLIGAINEGAKSAQLSTLSLLAIGGYLLATAFSVSGEDLLLNSPITIAYVAIPVTVTVVLYFAPFLLLAAYMYALIRYDMVAADIRQFNGEIVEQLQIEADRRRCRQLLVNTEFVQNLVTPPSDQTASTLFCVMFWFFLAVFPLTALLFMQISILRLQSEVLIWDHRVCLIVAVAALIWFRRRLISPRATVHRRVSWAWLGRGARLCWPALVILPDIAWSHVPTRETTTIEDSVRWKRHFGSSTETLGDAVARQIDNIDLALGGLRQPLDLLLCPATGWGCRYLSAEKRTLVGKPLDTTALATIRLSEPSEKLDQALASISGIDLHGRNLLFARLTESVLVNALLSDAKLDHAHLESADLRGVTALNASFFGANMGVAEEFGPGGIVAVDAGLPKDRSGFVKLQGARLRDANFERAFMPGAHLQGADLEQVNFRHAYMPQAQLQGAILSSAQMQDAELSGAQLQGASLAPLTRLWRATLWGADLSGADVRGAEFNFADLRRARFWNARIGSPWPMGGPMEGAVTSLWFADLRLADDLTPASADDIERALIGASTSVRNDVKAALTKVNAATMPTGKPLALGPILVSTSSALEPQLLTSQNTSDVDGFSEAAVQAALQMLKDHPLVAMDVSGLFLATVRPRFSICTDGRFAAAVLAASNLAAMELSPEAITTLQEAKGRCEKK